MSAAEQPEDKAALRAAIRAAAEDPAAGWAVGAKDANDFLQIGLAAGLSMDELCAIMQRIMENAPAVQPEPAEEDVVFHLGSLRPARLGPETALGGRRYGGGDGGAGQIVEVVNPRAPREMARQFLASQGMDDGRCVLRHWRGVFYRWAAECHYRSCLEDDLCSSLYAVLRRFKWI